MPYMLFLRETGRQVQSYPTEGAARAAMRRANKKAGWTRISRSWQGMEEYEWCGMSNGLPNYQYGPYAIMQRDLYENKYNGMVTVISLMNGQPVQIRAQDKGGPCDPSMEKYWTM